MTERVEWEVVDAPSARSGKRQAAGEAMRMMLGRGWKWKIAGTAIVSLVTLALFATLTGALVLLFTAGTLITVAVRKMKQWLLGGKRPAGATVSVRS
jgi:hypothetical protein